MDSLSQQVKRVTQIFSDMINLLRIDEYGECFMKIKNIG